MRSVAPRQREPPGSEAAADLAVAIARMPAWLVSLRAPDTGRHFLVLVTGQDGDDGCADGNC